MRTIREKIYYSDYDDSKKLKFPNTSKAYLETSCSEWECSSVEEKLLDLGYLVTHGFDLQTYVAEYVAERTQNEQFVISAFVKLISYLRAQDEDDYGMLILYNDDKISTQEAVELFCKEIVLRYEERVTYPSGIYEPLLEQQLKTMPAWDYKLLAELKLGKEAYYNVFKLPTDEYLRRINTI